MSFGCSVHVPGDSFMSLRARYTVSAFGYNEPSTLKPIQGGISDYNTNILRVIQKQINVCVFCGTVHGCT